MRVTDQPTGGDDTLVINTVAVIDVSKKISFLEWNDIVGKIRTDLMSRLPLLPADYIKVEHRRITVVGVEQAGSLEAIRSAVNECVNNLVFTIPSIVFIMKHMTPHDWVMSNPKNL